MKLVSINSENIDLLNCVMDMIYDEWGSNFSSSKEDKLEKIRNEILKGGRFPRVYLLRDKNRNIGAFSILEHELEGSDLSPWLACVVVNKKYRGKGYGLVLLDKIKEVIENTYSGIYLTTKMNGFYEKIGFNLIKIIDNNGENNRLYEKINQK